MKMQRLLSVTRKAIDNYHMIEEGDKIAVGISGGKDSLALLYALNGLIRFYPKHFELVAVTVQLGYKDMDFAPIAELCKELDVPYYLVETEISSIVFNERKESNPCSLCAKMRKGALNDKIKELGCNKVAFGHHRDDIIETMMMSLIYEGRFHSFSPVIYWDRMDITLIRPLMYMKETDIIGFSNTVYMPIVKNTCPVDGFTKREYIKQLLIQLNRDNPGVYDRMFGAIIHGDLKGWPIKYER